MHMNSDFIILNAVFESLYILLYSMEDLEHYRIKGFFFPLKLNSRSYDGKAPLCFMHIQPGLCPTLTVL